MTRLSAVVLACFFPFSFEIAWGEPASVITQAVEWQYTSSKGSSRRFLGQIHFGPEGARRLTFFWEDPPGKFTGDTDRFACSDFLLRDQKLWCWFGHPTKEGRLFEFSIPDLADQDGIFGASASFYTALKAACILLAEIRLDSSGSLSGRVEPIWNATAVTAFLEGRSGEWEQPATTTFLPPFSSGSAPTLFPPYGRRVTSLTEPDGTRVLSVRQLLDSSQLLEIRLGPSVSVEEGDARLFEHEDLGNLGLATLPVKQYWHLQNLYYDIAVSGQSEKEFFALLVDIEDSLAIDMPSNIRTMLLKLKAQVAVGARDAKQALDAYCGYLDAVKGTAYARDAVYIVAAGVERLHGVVDSEEFSRIISLLAEQIVAQGQFGSGEAQLMLFGDLAMNGWNQFATALIGAMEARDANSRLLIALRETLYRYGEVEKGKENFDAIPRATRDFLNQKEAWPPVGNLELDALRAMVSSALEKHPNRPSEDIILAAVEEILDIVVRTCGPGPYRGSKERLADPIKSWVRSNWNWEDDSSIVGVASVLVIAFYDNTTSKSHQLLREQLLRMFDVVESTMIRSLKNSALDAVDSEAVLSKARELFLKDTSGLIEDILWPQFKLELSDKEFDYILGSALRSAEQQVVALVETIDRIRDLRQFASAQQQVAESNCIQAFQHIILKVAQARSASVGGLAVSIAPMQPLRLHWMTDFPEEPAECRKFLSELLTMYYSTTWVHSRNSN